MQHVQHVRLGGDACLECHLDGKEHGIFIVLQDQSENLDHLPIAAPPFEQVLLQRSEGLRQFGKGRTVAQGTGFTLHYCQIVASHR